jgi:replicative DNA helicase
VARNCLILAIVGRLPKVRITIKRGWVANVDVCAASHPGSTQIFRINSFRHEAIEHSNEADEVISRAQRGIAQPQTDLAADPFKSYAEVTFPTLDAVMRQKEDDVHLTTSLPEFDDITTGIRESELWILAGDPGSGKSAVASQMAARNAKRGKRIGVFSIEMNSGMILQRAWSSEAAIPATKLRRPWLMTQEEQDRLNHVATNVVGEWPIFMNGVGTFGFLMTLNKHERCEPCRRRIQGI